MRNTEIEKRLEAARQRLDALVGTWTLEATLPGQPTSEIGRCTFEWMHGGKLLVQRIDTTEPFPHVLAVIATEVDSSFTQHYFDSRGVARVYQMTFDDELWTLLRTVRDFSPRDFSQRFAGRFADDGKTIMGAWEKTNIEGMWKPDFDLVYRRQA